jgi:hypothetical protein
MPYTLKLVRVCCEFYHVVFYKPWLTHIFHWQSFPSVIHWHILVLEAFWSWTTAIFITQKRFSSWLKRKLVRLLCADYSTTTNPLSVCKLIFLPPYSPDYNPIEQVFSSVKAWIRRQTMERVLLGIVKALQTVTPQKAAGWFRASGYM